MNLVVAVIGYRILPIVLSIHFPYVVASICVEADSITAHGLPFYNKAFGR